MEDKEAKIKRCAIYTRKSVEDGLEQEFNSLDAQREAGEAYVTSQKMNGWRLVPTHYDDGGFSGGNTNRPALKQLLKDCEEGKIDIIVVYKIDRLSRSICDFADLSKKFDKWGVTFCSVTQEINTNTSAGRMMLNILITFAQFEREVITERVRDKMAASRKKGKWVGGTVTFGYRLVEHKLVPEETELPIVRRVFQRYMEIQSPKIIATELNQEGVFNRNGRRWDTQTIYRMLNNHTYIGEISYQGQIYKGEHQGIIDRKLWEACQEIMKEGAPMADCSHKLENLAPLKGILRCGHCGGAMTPSYTWNRGRKYHYYTCVHTMKHPESECPIRQVPGGDIEHQVLERLKTVLTAPEIITNVGRATKMTPKQVMETFGQEFWQEVTPGECQRLMQLLLESVTVYPEKLVLVVRSDGLGSIRDAYGDNGTQPNEENQ